MIGRKKDPDNPGAVRFVALYMHRRPVWRGRHDYAEPMAAVQACVGTLAYKYATLAERGRILRGLCEHPEFEFEAPGIDADTIRGLAVEVDEMIQATGENVYRLLDEPEAGDLIRVGRERMTVDDGMLVPWTGGTDAVDRTDDVSHTVRTLVATAKAFTAQLDRGARALVLDRMVRELSDIRSTLEAPADEQSMPGANAGNDASTGQGADDDAITGEIAAVNDEQPLADLQDPDSQEVNKP